MDHQSFFNLDFFPTPEEVLMQMQIDCNGKRVLEPSAGKGNIIDFLKDHGAQQVKSTRICNTSANRKQYC